MIQEIVSLLVCDMFSLEHNACLAADNASYSWKTYIQFENLHLLTLNSKFIDISVKKKKEKKSQIHYISIIVYLHTLYRYFGKITVFFHDLKYTCYYNYSKTIKYLFQSIGLDSTNS